jgi:hypothetical protein
MTHQPKGGMCARCEHKHRDCSKLPFDKMRQHERDGDTVIVICSEFKKARPAVVDLRHHTGPDNYELGA